MIILFFNTYTVFGNSSLFLYANPVVLKLKNYKKPSDLKI